MKRTALALTLVLALLLSAAVGIQRVRMVFANPIWPRLPSELPNPPTINIAFPKNQTTLTDNTLILNFTVDAPWVSEYDAGVESVYYCLDNAGGKFSVSGNLQTGYSGINYQPLREGNHNITVNARMFGKYQPPSTPPWSIDYFFIEGSSIVYFTVDTVPPKISNVSPENKTYHTTIIPLNFELNESVPWMGYSLDAQGNVTVTGNMTLPELSYGLHNLTVYANDTAGNIGASETVNFTVSQKPAPQQSEPFPTTLAAVAIGSVAASGLGLLVYSKKRKQGLS